MVGTAAGPGAGRLVFVHRASVTLGPDGDVGAPGAAVTVALCGDWSHDPPCPLAPHHTAAQPAGDRLDLRVLFAAGPADEDRVRRLVDEALGGGSVVRPDGRRASWQLISSAPGDVLPEEQEHGRRLTRS